MFFNSCDFLGVFEVGGEMDSSFGFYFEGDLSLLGCLVDVEFLVLVFVKVAEPGFDHGVMVWVPLLDEGLVFDGADDLFLLDPLAVGEGGFSAGEEGAETALGAFPYSPLFAVGGEQVGLFDFDACHLGGFVGEESFLGPRWEEEFPFGFDGLWEPEGFEHVFAHFADFVGEVPVVCDDAVVGVSQPCLTEFEVGPPCLGWGFFAGEVVVEGVEFFGAFGCGDHVNDGLVGDVPHFDHVGVEAFEYLLPDGLGAECSAVTASTIADEDGAGFWWEVEGVSFEIVFEVYLEFGDAPLEVEVGDDPGIDAGQDGEGGRFWHHDGAHPVGFESFVKVGQCAAFSCARSSGESDFRDGFHGFCRGVVGEFSGLLG